MSKEGVHNLQSKKEYDDAINGISSSTATDSDSSDHLVVLDCYATWCGPCKVIAPQVVKMSSTYPNARFYKLDVDEVPEVAQELGVRAIPTFVLFRKGEKIADVVGANPKALETSIQTHYGA